MEPRAVQTASCCLVPTRPASVPAGRSDTASSCGTRRSLVVVGLSAIPSLVPWSRYQRRYQLRSLLPGSQYQYGYQLHRLWYLAQYQHGSQLRRVLPRSQYQYGYQLHSAASPCTRCLLTPQTLRP
eukprot:939997-Rhodomonas_salina.1